MLRAHGVPPIPAVTARLLKGHQQWLGSALPHHRNGQASAWTHLTMGTVQKSVDFLLEYSITAKNAIARTSVDLFGRLTV
eukprot:3424929-Amphidinium_carterae.1